MNRYSVLITEKDSTGKHRCLIVYLETKYSDYSKTKFFVYSKVEAKGFEPIGPVLDAGAWNAEKNCIEGDPYPITVEDNMHLIPSRGMQLKAKGIK